ncbi:MAG TPA: hypothetical protein VLI54_04130 [Bacillota bacterium]|nr:hypothetical protein [Bacillota bacterium]
MSTIEVEARALLLPEQRTAMLAYMHTLGPVQETNRVMFDFSGEDRSRTVTLRLNNGRQELVAKTGKLTDGVRREAKVLLNAKNTLEQALSYLAIMGHTAGMLSLRKVYAVKADGLEYSMRDILRGGSLERASTLLEIEALNVAEGQEQAASQKVHGAFEAQGLSPLSGPQWEQWVRDTYQNVDQSFENTPESVQQVVQALGSFIAPQ